jgi:hypothetical protein
LNVQKKTRRISLTRAKEARTKLFTSFKPAKGKEREELQTAMNEARAAIAGRLNRRADRPL